MLGFVMNPEAETQARQGFGTDDSHKKRTLCATMNSLDRIIGDFADQANAFVLQLLQINAGAGDVECVTQSD